MKLLLGLLLSVLTVNSYAFIDSCAAITQDNLCVELEWTDGPHVGAFASNVVRFKDLNLSTDNEDVYVTPAAPVKFYGWMIMASHEHGTRKVISKEVEPGVFENTKIFYMGGMVGIWQFKVTVGDEDFVLHAIDV
jgi:hypothetical protein